MVWYNRQMMKDNHLIIHPTMDAVKDVLDRVEDILNQKNIKIFARISHSQAAKDVGLSMEDEEVLIFGNPKVGTALMLENPAIGIELPLKIVAWRKDKQTMVAYQDLDKLATEFEINDSMKTIATLKSFLAALIDAALRK